MMKLGDKKILRIYAKHFPYPGHLNEVIADMILMGPPTINVVDYRCDYYAVEGSHRLAAAHFLGFVPTINILNQDRLDPSGEEYFDNLKRWIPEYTWTIDD